MSSLLRLAVRLSAVQALTSGGTLAEGRVFDSAIDPVDLVGTEENAKGIIVVTTDDSTSDVTGRDIFGAETHLDVAFETFIARRSDLEKEGGIVAVPETDAGLEISLDIMGDQIEHVLLGGNAWGKVFKKLCPIWTNIMVRRGGNVKEGVRFAAHQKIITLKGIPRPAIGSASIVPESPWGLFLAQCAATPKMVEIGLAVEKALLGEPLTAFEQLPFVTGVTVDGLAKTGHEPLFDDEGNEQPATEIEVLNDPTLDPALPQKDDDPLLVNDETAEQNDPGGA